MKTFRFKLFLFSMICVISFVSTGLVISILTKQHLVKDGSPSSQNKQIETSKTETPDKKDTDDTNLESTTLVIQASEIFTGENLNNKKSLTKVTIKNAAVIKKGAFKGCENLNEIEINVNAIVEEGAFEGVNFEKVLFLGNGEIKLNLIKNLELNPSFVKIIEIFVNYKGHRVFFDSQLFNKYLLVGDLSDNIVLFVNK